MKRYGQTFVGGLSRVFHCNYYNAFLQMTVLLSEGMDGCDPKRLLKDAVSPLVKYLRTHSDYSQEDLLKEFTRCGFGKLRQVDARTWETPHSHYSEAICLQEKPHKNCFFTSGYLQGMLEHEVEEVECQALGGQVDKFVVLEPEVHFDNYLLHVPRFTSVPNRFAFAGGQVFTTSIDENKIHAIIASLPLYGKEEAHENGLIEVFGVVLTNHFSDYYNRISYETYFGMCKAGIPPEDARELFIQAGLYCAFFTYGGIMESQEWYEHILPMCQTREDWLHAMIAVVNYFGWGVWRIEKIEPEKTLVIRVYNSYEGVGYRRMYPTSLEKKISFLAMGGCLGLAYLIWKIDIRTKPRLTWDFYIQNFNHPESNYHVTQTHAIAAEDEYDRFVVSRG